MPKSLIVDFDALCHVILIQQENGFICIAICNGGITEY
jgi:hypothetical protein